MNKNIFAKIYFVCAVMLLLSVSAAHAASGYDGEYTYQTGITLNFPDAVSYDFGSSRLAELTVDKNGQAAIRFKRPGDLPLTVRFYRQGYGEFTRRFIIHITGQPVDETAVNRTSFAEEILSLVNAERQKAGARPLKLAEDLNKGADVRAWEIVKQFSHTRPDGSRCFTVLKNQGRGVGENIAAGSPSAKKVMENWMNSPGHKANILNPEYKELGVGYTYVNDSEYKHYWVQLFRM